MLTKLFLRKFFHSSASSLASDSDFSDFSDSPSPSPDSDFSDFSDSSSPASDFSDFSECTQRAVCALVAECISNKTSSRRLARHGKSRPGVTNLAWCNFAESQNLRIPTWNFFRFRDFWFEESSKQLRIPTWDLFRLHRQHGYH